MPIRRFQAGISLIESLVCVVILSIGIIVVYRPLLTSLGAMSYLETRGEANRLFENRIWEFQESARTKRGPDPSVRETVMGTRRAYTFEAKTTPLIADEGQALYRSELTLYWVAGGRSKVIQRMVFTRIWLSA